MPVVKRAVRLTAKFFRGLADPSRLLILEALRSGPKNVSEVVSETGLSQPSVSMHLECLFCCGLVDRRKRGRFVYYRIRSPRTLRLLSSADRALEEVAGHIEKCSRYGD